MSLAAFGWAIVGLLAIAASNVRAWSCSPSEHRYFLDCRARQCSDAFFVAHVSATGRCMRRHQVFEIDAETRRFVAGLASTSSRLREDGVYVLRIPGPGWAGHAPDGSLGTLFRELDGARFGKRDDVPLRSMTAAALASMLDRRFGGQWFTPQPRFATLDAARRELRREAWFEYATSVLRAALLVMSVLVPLILLVQSAGTFFARLHRGARAAWHALAVPVAVQVGVLSLTPLSILIDPYDIWFGVVLAPAAIVILIAECVSCVRYRKLHQKLAPPTGH